ncbi:unnamed protein product [Amoebophrya sp. A120]|nr:unnamed protein product [Amoebophrya sp. A120]|eukprot:GSA120T00023343001.1
MRRPVLEELTSFVGTVGTTTLEKIQTMSTSPGAANAAVEQRFFDMLDADVKRLGSTTETEEPERTSFVKEAATTTSAKDHDIFTSSSSPASLPLSDHSASQLVTLITKKTAEVEEAAQSWTRRLMAHRSTGMANQGGTNSISTAGVSPALHQLALSSGLFHSEGDGNNYPEDDEGLYHPRAAREKFGNTATGATSGTTTGSSSLTTTTMNPGISSVRPAPAADDILDAPPPLSKLMTSASSSVSARASRFSSGSYQGGQEVGTSGSSAINSAVVLASGANNANQKQEPKISWMTRLVPSSASSADLQSKSSPNKAAILFPSSTSSSPSKFPQHFRNPAHEAYNHALEFYPGAAPGGERNTKSQSGEDFSTTCASSSKGSSSSNFRNTILDQQNLLLTGTTSNTVLGGNNYREEDQAAAGGLLHYNQEKSLATFYNPKIFDYQKEEELYAQNLQLLQSRSSTASSTGGGAGNMNNVFAGAGTSSGGRPKSSFGTTTVATVLPGSSDQEDILGVSMSAGTTSAATKAGSIGTITASNLLMSPSASKAVLAGGTSSSSSSFRDYRRKSPFLGRAREAARAEALRAAAVAEQAEIVSLRDEQSGTVFSRAEAARGSKNATRSSASSSHQLGDGHQQSPAGGGLYWSTKRTSSPSKNLHFASLNSDRYLSNMYSTSPSKKYDGDILGYSKNHLNVMRRENGADILEYAARTSRYGISQELPAAGDDFAEAEAQRLLFLAKMQGAEGVSPNGNQKQRTPLYQIPPLPPPAQLSSHGASASSKKQNNFPKPEWSPEIDKFLQSTSVSSSRSGAGEQQQLQLRLKQAQENNPPLGHSQLMIPGSISKVSGAGTPSATPGLQHEPLTMSSRVLSAPTSTSYTGQLVAHMGGGAGSYRGQTNSMSIRLQDQYPPAHSAFDNSIISTPYEEYASRPYAVSNSSRQLLQLQQNNMLNQSTTSQPFRSASSSRGVLGPRRFSTEQENLDLDQQELFYDPSRVYVDHGRKYDEPPKRSPRWWETEFKPPARVVSSASRCTTPAAGGVHSGMMSHALSASASYSACSTPGLLARKRSSGNIIFPGTPSVAGGALQTARSTSGSVSGSTSLGRSSRRRSRSSSKRARTPTVAPPVLDGKPLHAFHAPAPAGTWGPSLVKLNTHIYPEQRLTRHKDKVYDKVTDAHFKVPLNPRSFQQHSEAMRKFRHQTRDRGWVP